jgi:hypothetical protein
VVELCARFKRQRCVLLFSLLFSVGASVTSSADVLPDPTQPLLAASSGAGQTTAADSQLPVLQSIIYSKQQRKAVLNGRACREGALVGRYRVRAIYADRVVVEADGVRHTLRLFSHKVRYE